MNVKFYRIYDTYRYDPHMGSDLSACFDLTAAFNTTKEFKDRADGIATYTTKNEKYLAPIDMFGGYQLRAGERALIPTGIIFDLDENQSLRVHPRSGLALKYGITLMNAEGVIDPDYVEQTMIMLHNTSEEDFVIEDGMRIAQAEIVETHRYNFVPVEDAPEKKSNREGGFGSTGV